MNESAYSSYELSTELRESGLSVRIHNITDGVFAISMTLLMLNFRIPIDLPLQHWNEIVSSWAPEAFAYFLSFATLGAFWIGDYNHYRWIHHANRPFLWITILWLSFIALIPVSTALLGRYYTDQTVVIIYCLHIIICGLASLWQWAYASKNHRLVDKETDDATILRMKNRIRVPLVLIAFGILCSFISPLVTLLLLGVTLSLTIIPTVNERIADSFGGLIP